MIVAAAALTVVLALTLVGCGPRLAFALSGRAATLLLTAAALVCSLATGLVLCAVAGLAVAQLDVVADVGHWSETAVAAASPVPVAAAAACGVAAAALLVSAGIRAVRSACALVRSARWCGRLPAATDGLVVLDDPEPEAYALPGRPGRFVITRGMLRALSAAERRALLAHEAAHVTHHHYAYVELTRLAASANPLLRPLVGAVRVAVERWADEIAVAEVGDRQLVAVTLARAGLARQHARPGGLPAGALAVGATAVRQRTDALLTVRSPRRGRIVAALLVVIIAASVVSSGVVALRSHGVVEYAELMVPGGSS